MIKLVVFDFDGTLTNGNVIFIGNEIVKQYNIKDGMGIKLLQNNNIHVGVISGFKFNSSTKEICRHLKINYVAQSTSDKVQQIKQWMNELNITFNQVAFMGDDINDIELLKKVYISGCPKNASKECLDICRFVSNYNGGDGAVREFCEFVLNYQPKLISGLVCVKYKSNRCPMKNIRPFGNTTLLEQKLKQLLKLKFLDNVVLNTESDVIIDYVKQKFNNPKLKIVKRDVKYTKDNISNREFCIAMMESCNEHVLYSPVTMPFITNKTYNQMYEKSFDANYDSIILVADGKQGSGHDEEKHSFCFGASIMKKCDIIKFGDFIGTKPYFQQCLSKERIDIDIPVEFEHALYHYFNTDAIYGLENADSLETNALYLFEDKTIHKN